MKCIICSDLRECQQNCVHFMFNENYVPHLFDFQVFGVPHYYYLWTLVTLHRRTVRLQLTVTFVDLRERLGLMGWAAPSATVDIRANVVFSDRSADSTL